MLNWATMREEEVDISALTPSNGVMELSENEKEIIDALNEGETGVEHLSSKAELEKEEKIIDEESLESKLRKKINEIAYENPEKVLQILRYWINNG
jgi:flagellar biosynthesis/type III secretory pathway M-ring protein FliF/YscJ